MVLNTCRALFKIAYQLDNLRKRDELMYCVYLYTIFGQMLGVRLIFDKVGPAMTEGGVRRLTRHLEANHSEIRVSAKE